MAEAEEIVHGAEDDVEDLVEVQSGVDDGRDLLKDADFRGLLGELVFELGARRTFGVHGHYLEGLRETLRTDWTS